VRATLQSYNSNLLSYLSTNAPNATVQQIIGGQRIVSSVGTPLNTNPPSIYTYSGVYPIQRWSNQPTNFMTTFSISFAGVSQFWYTPQLQGQRVSLTFDSTGLAQLWLEDSNIVQSTNTGAASTTSVTLSVTHPYGGWDVTHNLPTDVGYFDASRANTYQRTNASYAILYGFEPSPQWLQERQQKLDAYRAQGLADTSRQVTTETLNVMGLNWMVQTELNLELLAQQLNQLTLHHHRFGRMAQELGKGYYVDAYLQEDGTFPNSGVGTTDFHNQTQVFDLSSYFWSAMEHGVIEQLQNSNIVASSTVKMLELALLRRL